MKQSEFLHNVLLAWNHRPLLWLALELTKDSKLPVGEFGAGEHSTPFLRKYCEANKRQFLTYDYDQEWADRWGAECVSDWGQERLYRDYSVVLIDQAPGEFRHSSMRKLKDTAQVIVVHDAEPDESMGYKLEEIWHLFEYRVFVKDEKIWAAAVSNTIDLSKHKNETIGDYKIEL